MMNQTLFNVLFVVVCVGSINWLWYANNASGMELVSYLVKSPANAKYVYDLIGLCGVGLLGCFAYAMYSGKSMMPSTCDM